MASTFLRGTLWGLADGEMGTTHHMLQIQSGSAGPFNAPRALQGWGAGGGQVTAKETASLLIFLNAPPVQAGILGTHSGQHKPATVYNVDSIQIL